jgi:hypothetical protein
MSYTILSLFSLGVLGILIHNLIKLNNINRKKNGKLNFRNYIEIEKFSILLSLCVVIVSLIIRSEIKELEIAGNYLGFAFVTIGYTAQSIVTAVGSKAETIINKMKEENEKT